MMKTGTCVPFASCISRSVDSRTWLMLPGAEVTFDEATVWIESTTRSAGRRRSAVSTTASISVSGSSSSRSLVMPNRSARILTCWADSSAET